MIIYPLFGLIQGSVYDLPVTLTNLNNMYVCAEHYSA